MAPTGADALTPLVAGQLASACTWSDPARDELVEALHRRHGKGIAAILLYGSYLRGKRDTMLDFYVLLDRYDAMPSRWQAALAWLLSPNVYQVRAGAPGRETRAKYALMTMGRFAYATRCDFHSYFWGRFAQPSALVYCRDEAAKAGVIAAVADASRTFARRVAPRLGRMFTARELVSRGLVLSYGAELRSEPTGHAAALYEHNAGYYQALVDELAGQNLGFERSAATGPDAIYRNLSGSARRLSSQLAWALRLVEGKLLSMLRLLKASLTFDDGLDYLLWKIERHTGVRVDASPRQRKYPLLFGWPVLIRLYRAGGFR